MRRIEFLTLIGTATCLASLSACGGDVGVSGQNQASIAAVPAQPSPAPATLDPPEAATIAQNCSFALRCAP